MAKAKTASQTTVASDQEKMIERAAKRVAKFKNVAPKRVTNALRALDKVIQVANKGRYTYDEEQARKIVEAISARTSRLHDAFTAAQSAAKEEFRL